MLVMAENSLSSLAAVYHPPEEEEDPNSLKLNPLGSRMGLVPGLVVLHLRKNGIKHLHGFTAVCFASLEYLNLRDNEIESVKDLKPLSELPKLRCLVLTDNPIQRVPNYRMETLMTVLTLRRLDKDNFSPEEVVEAKLAADRRRQEEAAARAAEEIGARTPPPMPSAEGQN
ncbi:hypothetical protein AAHC03_013825 [Spirometra sp. Aus1]|nr:unnamed protein product [Spirometra erinaceieuropaei]